MQMGGRSEQEWITQYASSHTHPVNRVLHTIGIPMILLSLGMFAASFFIAGLWKPALAVFALAWFLQFVGHAFERKLPEFFHDYRFLFVGLRWWMEKVKGKK